MEFNAARVLSRYERTARIDNKEVKYVLYPSKSDKMLVCFTTLGPHIYERIRMFWEENEEWDINFLFISDNNGKQKGGLYYLGYKDDYFVERQTIQLIELISELQNVKEIYTIGSSMGGYAAIYYAIKLNFQGAISVVPQANEELIHQYGWQKWKQVLQEVGPLPNLGSIIASRESLPSLYIQYGTYPADLEAAEYLKKSLEQKNGLYMFDCFPNGEHTSDFMTKELIYQILHLFSLKSNHGVKGGIG
ncbi:hypothetical protein [Metabacillus sediminilitoris]|uniref:Esterase n=1 Tax=Metabacillus sediminilitoris TaxID=2567941 RepID=A0A4S4C1E1_9BACI|nr:hypothetical protein [Metabacillus sediminilitoris]QGQ48166.1 hypothetical protein GMB29_24635 [Metabacillus sediminilitoris]THF81471.1 hypothetical protein E6W99_06070 [Metabacillus sediminilitoris]